MGVEDEVIIGVLGQWASGKTTAARTLVDHLGGEDEVIFLSDRVLLGQYVVNYVLQSEGSEANRTIEADGSQRFTAPLATFWLSPGEEASSVDTNTVLFEIHEEVYDNVPAGALNWMDSARLELGRQIRVRAAEGKPIVVEAAFGTDAQPRGENPYRHALGDLFDRLADSGLEADRIKWILVEASYATRRERNHRRIDSVPDVEFDRFATEGGDLDPEQARRWAERGTIIKRVANEHDDIERFKSEVIAACDEILASSR